MQNYSLAEQSVTDFAPIYSSRAATYLKLKKFNQALQVCATNKELINRIGFDFYYRSVPTKFVGILNDLN